MQYNKIYELVKPIYQWLEEHYPNDKYLKIETSGFSLCEDRTMGINEKRIYGINEEILRKMKQALNGEKENESN